LSFAEICGIRKLESLGYRAVFCVIVHLAISVEHQLETEGQTDTRRQLVSALASVAWINTILDINEAIKR